MRGDVRARISGCSMCVGSPPHARGRPFHCCRGSGGDGLTPACAGTSGWNRSATGRGWAHPRMRGDVGGDWWISPALRGSPPHARGRRAGGHREARSSWLTPACAGTSLAAWSPLVDRRAHPRMRGDVRTSGIPIASKSGSPPHARGRLRKGAACDRSDGLTPACAGTSQRRRRPAARRGAHPRMRGDVGFHRGVADEGAGSPPHARGRPPPGTAQAPVRGLTPACAGTSKSANPHTRMSWAHPRMRGDVSRMSIAPAKIRGSPPHARGRRRQARPPASRPGLTPACAGTSPLPARR